jgi:predicted RNA binding protein YcfA (HicA-like mRNA interferase family)
MPDDYLGGFSATRAAVRANAQRYHVKGEGQGSDSPARIYGLALKATKGSHRQFLHPQKGMVVTVPGQPGKDVPVGTLKAILGSAGLRQKKED